jgi:hypothetical protein
MDKVVMPGGGRLPRNPVLLIPNRMPYRPNRLLHRQSTIKGHSQRIFDYLILFNRKS